MFSLVREIWANKLAGKLSELAKLILLIFFPPSGESFHKGIIITHGDQSIIVRATFCGFLADEKCLKSVFNITGQAGNVPCINCLNVRNRWCKLKAGEQFFWDPAIENRKQTTRGHIDIMIRLVSEATYSNMGQSSNQLWNQLLPNWIALLYLPHEFHT